MIKLIFFLAFGVTFGFAVDPPGMLIKYSSKMNKIFDMCKAEGFPPFMDPTLDDCADIAEATGLTEVWTSAKGGDLKRKPYKYYYYNFGKGRHVLVNGKKVLRKGKKNCLALDVQSCKFVRKHCKSNLPGLCLPPDSVVEYQVDLSGAIVSGGPVLVSTDRGMIMSTSDATGLASVPTPYQGAVSFVAYHGCLNLDSVDESTIDTTQPISPATLSLTEVAPCEMIIQEISFSEEFGAHNVLSNSCDRHADGSNALWTTGDGYEVGTPALTVEYCREGPVTGLDIRNSKITPYNDRGTKVFHLEGLDPLTQTWIDVGIGGTLDLPDTDCADMVTFTTTLDPPAVASQIRLIVDEYYLRSPALQYFKVNFDNC